MDSAGAPAGISRRYLSQKHNVCPKISMMWQKFNRTIVLSRKRTNWPVHPVAVRQTPQKGTREPENDVQHRHWHGERPPERQTPGDEAAVLTVWGHGCGSSPSNGTQNRACSRRSRGSSVPAAPHPPDLQVCSNTAVKEEPFTDYRK